MGSTSFTVGFNLRNSGELANLIQAQETPGSPLYQHYLTAAQEAAMFGPDPTTVQNTINYYTSLGFTLQGRGAISLSFAGSVGQANGAFHTQLSNVIDGMANPEVVNALPLSVPGSLAGSIASINGFEGIASIHPTLMVDPGALADGIATPLGAAGPSAPLVSSSGLSPVHPGVDTLKTNESVAYNYTDHNFYWYNYYSHYYQMERWVQVVTPASLNYLYDASPLLSMGYNGNSTPGKQITIAIVMAGGINPGDMQAYGQMVWNNPCQLYCVPSSAHPTGGGRIFPLPVDRSSGLNGTTTWNDGDSNEMALDLEYSGTMAPGARLMPVYGACLCTNILDDDYAAIDNLATIPNIVSNSWGGGENGGSPTGPNWQNFNTMHNYFMLIDARGASVLASSGDGGGFDTGSGLLGGSFPATDPYVLSVNGIRTAAQSAAGDVFPNPSTYGLANISLSLTLKTNYPVHVNTATALAYQSFWYVPFSNTTLYSASPEASGGFGTSYWFNQSWWQHAPSAPDLGRALGSGVSAEADFNESIYFDGSFELGYGGTSFACPTTAGMLADILDYFQAHGHKAYLGDANVAVWNVGNAWANHNLTLNPYFDVTNGTSFWVTHGVLNGWQWPAGQKFPRDIHDSVDYGNTTAGWDFPTGFGVINVLNFAEDLNTLYSLPSQIVTMNAGATAIDPNVWANIATNHSYTFHVNASGALLASNPVASVTFSGENGLTFTPIVAPQTVHPVLTPAAGGYTFTLDTGVAPIDSPGLLVFTLGNATMPTAAFAYDWVSWALPGAGALAISVVPLSPGSTQTSIPGGSSTFGAGIPFFFIPIQADPEGRNGENLLLVHVTFNGIGVYDAVVTGQVASPYSLAFEGSRALNASQSYGAGNTPISQTVSTSYTNLTGYAYVWTWNVIRPTNLFINASYSTASASTNFTMAPPPNIGTTDNGNGKYSEFNWIAWILYATRQTVSKKLEALWAPNSLNQSGWYDMLYAWQGEQFKVNINDYQGHPMPGVKVWFGNYDTGSTNQFYDYKGSGGIIGYTNDSQSVNTTDSSGSTYIQIPQNESMSVANDYFGQGPYFFNDGPATFAAIAADVSGYNNSTDQVSERCPSASNAKSNILLTCVYNDTVRSNYTSTPVLVMPDPVTAWTQTPTGIHRDFFSTGSNISFGVTASL
ncbi:MAG: hypothetical protein L3K08_00430, partial [Thermoplasmata archaeon]|nr:hypothetical protein [Thermoplasmata archaeon]